MSRQTISLTPELHDYLLSHSLREAPLLAELRRVTAELPEAHMQIAPEQGQFMALLVELIAAKRILEVGTFTGYSALCMALALPGDGRLLALDVSEEWTAIARRFWQRAGVEARIELRLGEAEQTMRHLLAQGEESRFDLIFVDADKENYPVYFETGLELLRPGGLLMFDNTLWGGSVAEADNHDRDTEAIRHFNRLLHRDERISLSLVPIGDGLTLARKR